MIKNEKGVNEREEQRKMREAETEKESKCVGKRKERMECVYGGKKGRKERRESAWTIGRKEWNVYQGKKREKKGKTREVCWYEGEKKEGS